MSLIRKLMFFSFLVVLSNSFAMATPSDIDSRISDRCSPDQIKMIEQSAMNTRSDIEGLQSKIEETLGNGGHTSETIKFLNRSKEILSCMARKVDRTRYVCKATEARACENGQAYVGGGIALGRIGTISSSKIHLCWNFWDNDDLFKRATLVHETSHLCGTNDAAYFGPEHGAQPNYAPVPTRTWSTIWPKVADTYGFWIRHGFCVPGENCVPSEVRRVNHISRDQVSP